MKTTSVVAGAWMVFLIMCCTPLPRCAEDDSRGSQGLPKPLVVKKADATTPTLAPGTLIPDGTETRTVTLDEAIRQALLSNPELQAKYASFRARLLKAPQVRSMPDPMLQYTHFVKSIQTRTGEQEWILGISQKFPWFGKLELQGEIACDEALMALMEYRSNMLDVVQQVTRAYYQLAFEYAAFDLALEEKQYLVDFVAIATTVYATGQKGRQAVLKAQTELAKTDSALLSAPAHVQALVSELNRLMGHAEQVIYYRPLETPVEFADLEQRNLLGIAFCLRPELGRIDQMIEASRKSCELARLDYFPNVTLGANYFGVGSRPDIPSGGMPPPDEGEDAWAITLGLNIPLHNARRRAQIAEAHARQAEAGRLRQAMQDRIAATIQEIKARLNSLNDQVVVYEDSILPLAQEAFEAAQSEYQAGQGTFLDLLDAERTLLKTRRTYLELVRDYQLAMADLERAVGTRIHVADRSGKDRETKP